MRAIKRLILGVFLLALVMVAAAFALPRHVSVERSAVINAPELDVFVYLNSPKKFNEWSPWAARDPEMHYVFSGPVEGVGARMEWDSDEFGKGSQEIVESNPGKNIVVALDFDIQGAASSSFVLSPAGAGTKLSWGMNTDVGNNPLGRWTGLMLDRWIGADYEQGLTRLKQLVESGGASR